MMKNWKSLFVKEEGGNAPAAAPTTIQTIEKESFTFPVGQSNLPNTIPQHQPTLATIVDDPAITEVLKVYENGLDSINMPGYDFFEYYKSVTAAGQHNSQLYNMAFQMASALDKTITVQKLLTDAEFYISKINEVHSQYGNQGQQRLNGVLEKKASEKTRLSKDVDQTNQRISQLRSELVQLESDIKQKVESLSQIDAAYLPQEQAIKEKMTANDVARNTSIAKLNVVKEGITNFIK